MQTKIFKIRVAEGFLQNDQAELNAFLETVQVRKTATQLIEEKETYWSVMIFYKEKIAEGKKKSEKNPVTEEVILTEEETKILSVLKEWRSDKAKELGLTAFMVTHNSELLALAQIKPKSIDELQKIRGFGGKKIEKFGGDIIALMNSI